MNHEFQIGFLKHNIHLHASVPNKFEFMIRSREGRINFSIRNFAVKYGVGLLRGANFFCAGGNPIIHLFLQPVHFPI